MKAPRQKLCIGCHTLFAARRDAKTCSTKCRKRYQRAREHYIVNHPEMSHLNTGKVSHINNKSNPEINNEMRVLTLAI